MITAALHDYREPSLRAIPHDASLLPALHATSPLALKFSMLMPYGSRITGTCRARQLVLTRGSEMRRFITIDFSAGCR